MLHAVWQSCACISHLQLFLSWESRQRFFVEVTFFPEDIAQELFSLDQFFQFLQPIVSATGVEQFYVRYENASWEFGDTSATAGVILSAAEYREWAKDVPFHADIHG